VPAIVVSQIAGLKTVAPTSGAIQRIAATPLLQHWSGND